MGVVLSLILGFSLFIRGSFISVSPPELFGDEIDVGYQAYSLLKTGRDLYNQPFPTYIHSLSEWRAPLLMYFTVPTISIFGNNELGVRTPEIILGTLGIAIIFLLAYETTKSKSISLLTSLSLALTPWYFHYSRTAFEVVLLLNLIMLGTLFFIKKRHLLAAILFALSIYTYNTAVVFTPLLILTLWFLYKPKLKLAPVLIFVILLIPFCYFLFFGKAQERFSTVSILNNSQITEAVIQMRSQSLSPFERLFTNRPIFIIRKFADNYLSAFSTDFLFVHGDPTIRHNTNFTGQLLPILAIPLFLGLFLLAKHRHIIWLIWLFLAPIPAALTYDGASHATRLFLLLPPLVVALGAGFNLLFKSKVKMWLGVPIIIITLFSFFQYLNYYFYQYPRESWRWWHVGYKTALQQLNTLDSKYARIFINNTYEPSLIRFLFYSEYSPAIFHRVFTLDQPMPNIYPNYYGFFLPPKYYFGSFSIPKNKSLPDILADDSLYMISQRDEVYGDWRKNPPLGVKVLFTSTNPYDDPIFYLVTRP